MYAPKIKYFPYFPRLKGIKKTEQYRLLCAELEMIIRGYATNSHHKVILENIQNVRAACGDASIKAENENSRKFTIANLLS